MTFAVVVEGICIVAYLVILTGGKRLRESGWRFLTFLILIAAIVQAASMALVVRYNVFMNCFGGKDFKRLTVSGLPV